MSAITKTLNYSIIRKLVMALTGLFLVTFLTVHMSGNLLLFKGAEAFNEYSEFMATNTFIRVNEFLLLAGFLFHILDAFMLTRKNSEARPVKYVAKVSEKNSTWFSRNMGITGTIILVFLVLHMLSFFARHRAGLAINFGASDAAFGDGSMYDSVKALFQLEWYSGIYVIAMVFLGFHLNHGFQSAFQSLGVNHQKYTPIIRVAGMAFSIIVPALFASMPLYFLYLKYSA